MQATELVQKYAAAMSAGDPDALAALFASDATRQDPIGAPVNCGQAEIREAFAAVLPTDDTLLRFAPGPIRGSETTFAFTFEHTVTRHGRSHSLTGDDVLTVNEDALIQDAVAYWGEDDWSRE